ncbi:MAG: hypothetical protein SFZ24_12040 [Planctomycetota bacterium]|nr:hypothetical protein [Planctomycetota bacterium]
MTHHRVLLDETIQRQEVGGFAFPLGAYPTEPLTPIAGYTMQFEAADGSDATAFAGAGFGEELEEWPDRYVFDIAISHTRVRSLCRALFGLLPGRFFPILDILGNDAYREIDPYIAYDLVGAEKFYDGLRAFEPWLFEDGLVGFGSMSVEPFFYVFLDEHKIVTVRCLPEMREKIERLLATFDLRQVEELEGVDSVAHEHRGVIVAPEDKPDALTPDEAIERLRDAWSLELNIDPMTNLDAEGNELGLTAWQCVVRCTPEDDEQADAYAELLLSATCLHEAEELATDAVEDRTSGIDWDEVDVIRADRITADQLKEWLGKERPVPPAKPGVHDLRWLAGGPAAQGGAR